MDIIKFDRYFDKFLLIIAIAILCLGFVTTTCNRRGRNIEQPIKKDVVVYDTTYNKVVLDSIERRIIRRDSVIVDIKRKIQYDVEKAMLANDSDAIKQFKRLAGE